VDNRLTPQDFSDILPTESHIRIKVEAARFSPHDAGRLSKG